MPPAGGGEAEMGQTAPLRRSLPAEPGSSAPGRPFSFARPGEGPAAAELRAGLGGEEPGGGGAVNSRASGGSIPSTFSPGEKIPVLGNSNPNPPSGVGER